MIHIFILLSLILLQFCAGQYNQVDQDLFNSKANQGFQKNQLNQKFHFISEAESLYNQIELYVQKGGDKFDFELQDIYQANQFRITQLQNWASEKGLIQDDFQYSKEDWKEHSQRRVQEIRQKYQQNKQETKQEQQKSTARPYELTKEQYKRMHELHMKQLEREGKNIINKGKMKMESIIKQQEKQIMELEELLSPGKHERKLEELNKEKVVLSERAIEYIKWQKSNKAESFEL